MSVVVPTLAYFTEPTPTRLLTVSECAQHLRVSECWVRRHRHALGATYLGKTLRFDPRQVDAFVQAQSSRLQFPPIKHGGPLEQPKGGNMLQRKRWQRGAVYLRRGRATSTWYGRFWEDSLTIDGKIERRYRNVRLGTVVDLPTKTKARDALGEHLRPLEEPAVVVNFSVLCKSWREVHEQTLKGSTFNSYKNLLVQLEATFGTRPINRISRHDVERLILDKATTYSRSRVRSLRTTLSIVMRWAVDNDWLERNPVTGVKLPRRFGGRTITRNVLAPADVMRLANALEEPVSTLVVLLYSTGLRIGEAAGLRWSDLEDQVLHVRRRIYEGQVDSTKTGRSERKLPLPTDLVTRLVGLRSGEGDSWMFQARNGSTLNPRNWLRRWVRPAAKELGLTLSGWHDLRCSLATNLRRQGAHPKIVSSILGHSRVQLALDTYDLASTAELAAPLEGIGRELHRS